MIRFPMSAVVPFLMVCVVWGGAAGYWRERERWKIMVE